MPQLRTANFYTEFFWILEAKLNTHAKINCGVYILKFSFEQ